MKRFYFFLALVGFSLNVMADEWTDENGVTWTYTVNGDNATITKASPAKGDLVFPNLINGKRITAIGESTFYNCSNLTSVTISDDVTSIGSAAFYDCSSLTSVMIGDGVTSIGKHAFRNCSSLTSITIPDGVASIGSWAFYDCSSLTSITIPNSVTVDGKYVFSGCGNVKEVNINIANPNVWSDLSEILPSVIRHLYQNGEEVTSLILSEGLTSIPNYAFRNSSNLTSVTIPNSVTSIGNEAFNGCSNLTSIMIGDGVTSIGNGAFNGCSNLTSITIPNSVTSIGNYAFLDCDGLTSITIPNSVLIEPETFLSCDNVQEVNINIANPNVWSDEFGNLPNGTRHLYQNGEEVTSLVLPEGLTSIPDLAFKNCSSLTSVTIPEGVTTIGNNAFQNCSNLTSITIPNSVTSIGSDAFENCSNLTSVTIPNSVTSIGYWAFSGCSSLTSVTIPSSVTSIGNYAFYDCDGLTSITIPNSVVIEPGTFHSCDNVQEINIIIANPNVWSDQFGSLPDVTRHLYKDGEEVTNLVLSEGLTSIPNFAFRNCSSLTSVSILNSVTTIGNNAFQNCSNLTSITIPNSVTSIGAYAFYNCSNLTSVTIPNSVTNIRFYAFCNCSSLTSVTIPSSVTSIEHDTFSNCYSLTSVTIPNNVTSIGESAFSGCSSLTSVTIPNSVTSIGGFAFNGCSSLTSVTIPNSVTSIGVSTFFNCSGLTSITIPNSVTTIGDYAFENCSSLTFVTIPNSVTSIGILAFSYCSNVKEVNINIANPNVWSDQFWQLPNVTRHLYKDGEEVTSLVLPEGLTSIPNYAFRNCSSLTSVTIPNSVTSIGKSAFESCFSLTSVTIPNNVKDIGESAFAGCSSLVILTNISVTPPSITSNVLNDKLVIIVPAEALDAYKSAPVWSDYAVHIIPNNAVSEYDVNTVAKENSSGLHQAIGEENLLNVMSLKVNGTINSYDILLIRNKMLNLKNLNLTNAVIVPSSQSYLENYKTESNVIGPSMFSGLNLVAVKLPKDVISIRANAFSGCSLLRELEINSDLDEIGFSAFSGTRIDSLVIPKCGSVGNSAFHEVKMLMLKMKDVEEIGPFAFSDSSIDSLMIDKVKIMGERFCRGMSGKYVKISPSKDAKIALPNESFRSSNASSIVLGKGFIRIDDATFAHSGVQEITLPEGLIEIGNYAFDNCRQLQSIAFPSTLTQIGAGAFWECSKIEEIRLPLLTNLGENAFSGCNGLKEVKLPSSLELIGNSAFSGCDSIESVYTYTLEPISIGTSTFSQRCFQYATLYVPETSYYTYYFNTEWSQFQHLKQFSDTYDYFYLDKDYLIDDETGTIKGNPDADLNAESGLIVRAKANVQTLGNVVMDQKDDGTSASIIAEANNIEIDTLTVQLKVEAGKWIFYTPTKDVRISDCQYPGQYVWYDYDGAQRAASGTGWTKLSADTDMLEAGHGYILQSDVAGTVTLHYVEPTFGEDVEVELETHDSENVADANWNLTGNPYTSYYDLLDDDYDAPIITWNVKKQNYEAYRPGDDDCHLQPGQAFFVQKVTETAAVTFSAERRETYTESQENSASQVKARRARGINPRRCLINLTLSNDNIESDRTRVVLNEDATLGYDMGADAAKFASANAKAQLFTIDEHGSRYAINERPVGEVPVGYIAKEEGMLTISAPRMDRKMLLLDREMNVTHDLSASDYNFSTKAGTYTNRFVLFTPAVPTDVAQLAEKTGVVIGTQTGGISVGNAEGKTISIYAFGGQLMGTHTGNGFIGLPHGVYMVKVEKASAKVTVK